MSVVQATALTLVLLSGTGVVLTRDPLRQVMVNSLFGLALSLLFAAFQAPDVALSMLVVGMIAYPIVLLVTIGRVRSAPAEEDG